MMKFVMEYHGISFCNQFSDVGTDMGRAGHGHGAETETIV
jgi:hypothetical protein